MNILFAMMLSFFILESCQTDTVEVPTTCNESCIQRGAELGFMENEMCWCQYNKPKGREDASN